MTKPSAILLGSKPGSVVALSIMLERGWDIRGVVVCPKFDYPWLPDPTLEEYALKQGLKIYTDQRELASERAVDFVISYMYRHLVKIDTLQLADRAAVNFHAGPLPEFGGWAFYSVAIAENSTEYGCTCHYMDEQFDNGPLLKVRRFSINAPKETAFSLEKKAQSEMIELFHDFCDMAMSEVPLPQKKQDKNRMRYLTHKQFEALKEIPVEADEETVDRLARAFWYPPYECAYMRIGDTKIEVVPRLVKEELATVLHKDDLKKLHSISDNLTNKQRKS